MRINSKMNVDHDRNFKELVSMYFIEFLRIFRPEIVKDIDPGSLHFMDKELNALRQPERNKSANLLAADKQCFVTLAKRILFDTPRSRASPCLSGAAHLCRFISFGLPNE